MIPVDRPAYRVLATAGFFGPNDHLYHEGECIVYDGEPNEELEPLNQPARELMTAYLEKLDALGREAAAKAGRPFTGRPRTLDGALVLASKDERSRMAIMNAPKTVETIELVEDDPIPEVGNANPKRGRGRPPKTVEKLIEKIA